MPPAPFLENWEFRTDLVSTTTTNTISKRKLPCSKDENDVSNNMNGVCSSDATNTKGKNEGWQQHPTNCKCSSFGLFPSSNHCKERPLPLTDQSTRLNRLSLIDEWPQRNRICGGDIPNSGEGFGLSTLQRKSGSGSGSASAERGKVERGINIKRSTTGTFHRRQGSGDLYTKLQHFDNGDVIIPRKQQQQDNERSTKTGSNRYVVTGHGSWGDFGGPLFSQNSRPDEISCSTKPPVGKSSIPEAEYEVLSTCTLKLREGTSLPTGTSGGGGGGVSGLKEWYKNRTLVSKATSKAEAPPKPKYLRKLVLSSWKNNGTAASAIFNMISKRPLQSSPVISLKALITIHKLLQQGPPECRSACLGKLPLLIDIANTFRKQVGSAQAEPYCMLISSYTSMLVEKVYFHHKFPVYENNYSVDFSEVTSQPSCSGEAAQEPPRADALAYLQKIQDLILVALEEGFTLLRSKSAMTGEKAGGMRIVPTIGGAGGTSGLVGGGELDPIELVKAVLIPILREADLVYDICWFLLSSQLPVWEAGRQNPETLADDAQQMILKFGTQHKALRVFFEQAKSEAAIACTVTPPTLPLDPPRLTVIPNNELVRFSHGNTLDQEYAGTRYNSKPGALLDDFTDIEAERPNSVPLEGKGNLEVGESAGVQEFDDSWVHQSGQLPLVGKVLPRLDEGGPVVGGVGAAAAAAIQRFAAGQAEARRVAAAATGDNAVAPLTGLRNIRLEPPPGTLGFNLQLEARTFFRPERPQHTRGVGRTWSSFDDQAFLHQHLKGNPWSPIPRLVSPKFYSPRALGPSKDVSDMLSPCGLKSSSPLLFGLVGPSQTSIPGSPFGESPPAPIMGMELKHCPISALGPPFQPKQLQDQPAELQRFSKYPLLTANVVQLNFERPETTPLIEMEASVVKQSGLQTADQQLGTTEKAELQSGVPASWELEGSMSDSAAWSDLASSTQPAVDGSLCRKEIPTEIPLAADWEIPVCELKLGPKIGQGAFGDVLRGTWQGTDVAVKRLQNSFGAGYSQAIEEIRHEVAVIMRLRHPNIILFMGACTVPPEICIVMEFAANGSLFGVLHNPNITIDMATVVRWASEAARGMNYLHTRNPPVVHRDLKSVNLLVDGDWHIKVSDFGLAMTKQSSYAYTQVGTWGWMAPEVLESTPYDEKADVYSFGVVLWELITRDEPFKGYHPMQIMRAIDRGERPPIPEGCPNSYRRLIADCWHVDPKCRPVFVEILVRLSDISNALAEQQR